MTVEVLCSSEPRLPLVHDMTSADMVAKSGNHTDSFKLHYQALERDPIVTEQKRLTRENLLQESCQ